MGIIELIGRTPMLRLSEVEKKYALSARLYAKLEMFNPGGSVKDRAALFMIENACRSGVVGEGSTVIEATSGNLGISLAMLSSAFGYRALILMPEGMSVERRKIIEAYGGEVILTEAEQGMKGAIKRAEELAFDLHNSYICSQFTNPQNSLAHYMTTGPEIYNEREGDIDIFVAGVGTGGTLMGAGRYLKEKNPGISIVAVEPEESAVLSGNKAGIHKIQGIGGGFLPPLVDMSLVDEVIMVESERAVALTCELALVEGIFAGISSGAALAGAISMAQRNENKNKSIVTLFADGGEKYLSVL